MPDAGVSHPLRKFDSANRAWARRTQRHPVWSVVVDSITVTSFVAAGIVWDEGPWGSASVVALGLAIGTDRVWRHLALRRGMPLSGHERSVVAAAFVLYFLAAAAKAETDGVGSPGVFAAVMVVIWVSVVCVLPLIWRLLQPDPDSQSTEPTE